jgi:hypothetical protein
MENWNRSQNPFLIATKNSFVGAMTISTWHDGALNNEKADTEILSIYNVFHPKHQALTVAFDNWTTAKGNQEAKTLETDQLFEELAGEKARGWDVHVQNVYPLNSPEYKRLLPNRRIPFQTGKQVDRVEAVRSLGTNIGTDAALTALKTEVDAFCTLLETALIEQKGLRSATKNMSEDLEAARVEMCQAMFASLGALLKKYAKTPEKIDHFFDLETIRRSNQTFFTGTIKPMESTSVVKHTFNAGDEVIISNLSNATLRFYLAKLKGDQPGTKFVELPKGVITIPAEHLGSLTDTYLMVMNTNGDILGKYQVEIT